MSETVRVSERFYEYIASHKRHDETMEDALRRLIGGPDLENVAGILSSETTETLRSRMDAIRETDTADKRDLRERFE